MRKGENNKKAEFRTSIEVDFAIDAGVFVFFVLVTSLAARTTGNSREISPLAPICRRPCFYPSCLSESSTDLVLAERGGVNGYITHLGFSLHSCGLITSRGFIDLRRTINEEGQNRIGANILPLHRTDPRRRSENLSRPVTVV